MAGWPNLQRLVDHSVIGNIASLMPMPILWTSIATGKRALRSVVGAWQASHPAEPIAGAMFSNLFAMPRSAYVSVCITCNASADAERGAAALRRLAPGKPQTVVLQGVLAKQSG